MYILRLWFLCVATRGRLRVKHVEQSINVVLCAALSTGALHISREPHDQKGQCEWKLHAGKIPELASLAKHIGRGVRQSYYVTIISPLALGITPTNFACARG